LNRTGVTTFVVDIDGILCNVVSHTQYSVAKPNNIVVQKVRDLHVRGHKIILYTSRHEIDREVSEKWLRDNAIPYTQLVMDKPQADYYIDDKFISVDNWIATEFPEVSKYYVVSWEEYLIDVEHLCSKLPPISRVIGVPRKGLIPATLVALKLRLPMASIEFCTKNDLVVDDDSISGNSLKALKDKYGCRTATIYSSSEVTDGIDYYSRILNIRDLDDKRICIVYPWEEFLMPLNFNPWESDDFGKSVVEQLYGKTRDD